MKAAEVASIFNGTAPKFGGQPVLKYDCKTMAVIELAYGVLSQLKPGEFDALGLTPAHFANDIAQDWSQDNPVPIAERFFTNTTATSATGLNRGDVVRFMNADNYESTHGAWPNSVGFWRSEYTIKTSSSGTGDTHLYYGWGRQDPKTEGGWITELYNMYNTDLDSPFDRLWSEEKIPGYQGNSWFINVQKLAQKIFDLRTSATQ